MSPSGDRSRFSKELLRLNAGRVIPLRGGELVEDIALTIRALVRLPLHWESSLRSFLTSFRKCGRTCRRHSDTELASCPNELGLALSFLVKHASHFDIQTAEIVRQPACTNVLGCLCN